MGMGIKIFDWKTLHFTKHIVTQVSHHSLCDKHHDPCLYKSSGNTARIETGNLRNSICKGRKVRRCIPKQRNNIAVDQSLHKHRSLGARQYIHYNADHNNKIMGSIIFQDICHQTPEQFPRILNLRSGASWSFGTRSLIFFGFSFFRHDHSSPFSSKSPLPEV